MLPGSDPLLPQPGPPDHRAGDALGDEHSVAAGQVLAAWTRTGHDQVLYKGEKQELSKSSKGSTDSLLQANVTEFLDTEGLPRELGGEDDWQYSWQVFSYDGVDKILAKEAIYLEVEESWTGSLHFCLQFYKFP